MRSYLANIYSDQEFMAIYSFLLISFGNTDFSSTAEANCYKKLRSQRDVKLA